MVVRTKENTLTKERLNELFEYRDGSIYWKGGRNAGKQAGGLSAAAGYRRVCFGKWECREHQIIFMMHHGYMPEMIDHIDCDKLNNRIENLRACTRSENLRNVSIHKRKTPGTKNVYKQKGSWVVSLTINKKPTYFGCFQDYELAELVAIEARNKYHKSFANHSSAGA